jgi:hypothetical protein
MTAELLVPDCASRHLRYLGRNGQGRIIHDVSSRSKPTFAMDQDIADRHRRNPAVDHIFPDSVSYLPVSALQYPGRFDGPHIAGG